MRIKIRDLIAIEAFNGLLSSIDSEIAHVWSPEKVATASYQYADALIKEGKIEELKDEWDDV